MMTLLVAVGALFVAVVGCALLDEWPPGPAADEATRARFGAPTTHSAAEHVP